MTPKPMEDKRRPATGRRLLSRQQEIDQMPNDKDTLVVPLTREEKRALKAAAKDTRKKMTAIAREALMAYMTGPLKRPWPAPAPDGRRKPTKQRTPLPHVEAMDYQGHTAAWMKLIRLHGPDAMTQDVFLRALAHYQAAKSKGGREWRSTLRAYWHDVSVYRDALEQGRELPAVVGEDAHRYFVGCLWRLGEIRRHALQMKWIERMPVDRYELSPQKQDAIRADERRRAKLSRAKNAPQKAVERAEKKAAAEDRFRELEAEFCAEPDNDQSEDAPLEAAS